MFTYITPCLPDWLDYNGHMNDACYGRVFSDAIDAMMDAIGLDAAYRAQTKGTLYTVEDHRWYEQEVQAGAVLEVQTLVLDFDAKRLHIWQGLFVAAQSVLDESEVIVGPSHLHMLLSRHGLCDLNGPAVLFLGYVVVAQLSLDESQVIVGPSHLHMLLAQHLLVNFQGVEVPLLCHVVVA